MGLLTLLLLAALAQVPVPSRWEGEATGEVQGKPFRVPLHIAIDKPLAEEKNPFHLFVASEEAARKDAPRLGGVLFTSASRPFTSAGAVTLQYATIRQDGPSFTAALTDVHSAESLAMNTFTAPNLSAEHASEILADVLKELGPTEIHLFRAGAVLKAQVSGATLSGSLEGTGASVLATIAPDARYKCTFRARRVVR